MPPYFKQETDFYCGPAVVQMVLAQLGIIFSHSHLAKELGTNPQTGTGADAIAQLLVMHGLSAERRNDASVDDIRHALAEGRLALVGYIESQDGEPHYALVASVGENDITLKDPLFGDRYVLPLAEFEERWRDNTDLMYGNRMMIAVS